MLEGWESERARSPTRSCPTGMGRRGRCADPRVARPDGQATLRRSSPSSGSMATRILLAGPRPAPPDRWCVVDFGALRENPHAELSRVCDFAGLEWDAEADSPRRGAPETWPPPRRRDRAVDREDRGAARRGPRELARASPPSGRAAGGPATRTAPRTRRFAASTAPTCPTSSTSSAARCWSAPTRPASSSASARTADRRQHALPPVRQPDGPRPARRPARDRHPRAGVRVPRRPEPRPRSSSRRGKHDACFVPRRSHFTGDIRIHEVAYAGDELWIVTTRFSCLAHPRRRPQLRAALAPAVHHRARRRGPLPPERRSA